MQAAEMRMIRMMCRKTFRDGIPKGLLGDKTGSEDIENHLGETRLRYGLDTLKEWMKQT